MGATRAPGTTALIEDVAFPIESLSEALVELQRIMQEYGYDDGVIYGHALDGNLHFIFSQGFQDDAAIERYRCFMDDICHMVIDRYDGSLKAEHGTGRNMAPYVHKEWGDEAYDIMLQIKHLLDPDNILNPDVMINDPNLHIRNLKPLAEVSDIIDQCIECGFCERMCPSRELSLSPRQRIITRREMDKLKEKKRMILLVNTIIWVLILVQVAAYVPQSVPSKLIRAILSDNSAMIEIVNTIKQHSGPRIILVI